MAPIEDVPPRRGFALRGGSRLPTAATRASLGMHPRQRAGSSRRSVRCLGFATTLALVLAACGSSEPAQLTLILVSAWDLPVETVCIESSEFFPGVDGTPFADQIAIGVDSIESDEAFHFIEPRVTEQDCDITVEVAATGLAIPSEYTNTYGLSSTTLYLGWDISGTITVSAPDREPLVVVLDEHRDPPRQTSATAELAGTPRDAIENAVDEGAWCSSFWALFGGRTSDWARGICT